MKLLFWTLVVATMISPAIGQTTYSSSGIDWGNVPIGETRATSPLLLEFAGSDRCSCATAGTTSGLCLSRVSIQGGHSADFSHRLTCGGTAASGFTGKIDLTFRPTGFGQEDAELIITFANRSTGNTFVQTHKLAGYGIPSALQVGQFAQVASGAGWKTTIILMNLTTSTVMSGQIRFYGDSGADLILPLFLPQTNTRREASGVDFNISRGSSFIIETAGDAGAPVKTGWAIVEAIDPAIASSDTPLPKLDGYEILQLKQAGREFEAVVPMYGESFFPFTLAYDNTAGYRTAIALATASPSMTTITATATDDRGVSLFVRRPTALPARGHTSFYLDEAFPELTNRRGTITFTASPYGENITGLGFRFNPSGAFTSIPLVREILR